MLRRFFILTMLIPSLALSAVTVSVNGSNHTIPQTNERGWGNAVTAWIQAISQYTLQPIGGSFTLGAEVDFGSSFGLKSTYYKSRGANLSSAGVFRLANLEGIGWRNAANSANLLLSVNGSDQLTFNGIPVATGTSSSFQDSTFSLYDNSDNTKLLAFQLSEITTGTTRTLTAPDVNTTIVGTDATQTLTNKTISGASNTFSNIPNSATTATSANTNSAIVARDGSGNFSAGTISAALSGNASTATALASNPSDCASSQFATTIDAQGNLNCSQVDTSQLSGSITNSQLAGSIAASKLVGTDIATVGTITSGTWNGTKVAEAYGGTNQSTYATGDMLYASASNTLSKLAIGSSGQVLKQVGGVPTWATFSGGINYLSSNPDAEGNATSGWATYSDAAAASPVDGTAGSPSATWTTSSSLPLRGSYSFLLTKGATNRQGDGASFDFTIDKSDKGKVIQGSFDYAISSGTFADDDVSVWIYDVTNGALIQPAPYKLKNHSVDAEKFGFEFQSSSSSTSYRLILHIASTSASAYTLKFDNFNVGPNAKLYGSPVTDWVSFTPTGAWSTNTTYTGKWRRVGDSMEIRVDVSLAGAPTSASFTVNLPSGYSIDTTKVNSTGAGRENFGAAVALDSGTTQHVGIVTYNSATNIYVLGENDGGNPWTQAVPFTFGASDSLSLNFKVPIAGWGSQVIMSQDASTRAVAASYVMSGNQSISSGGTSVLVWNSRTDDSHGMVNTSTGVVTIPVPGRYRVEAVYQFSTSGTVSTGTAGGDLRKNSTAVATRSVKGDHTVAVNLAPIVLTYEGECVAGDTFDVRATQTGNGAAMNVVGGSDGARLVVTRLSSPSQIAASESVVARYTSNAGQSISNGSTAIVDFEDVDYDSHQSVTTGGSWKFTAPVSGVYQVTAAILYGTASFTQANGAFLNLYKNGSIYSESGQVRAGFTGSQSMHPHFTETIRLLAGEYIDVRTSHSESAARSLTSATPGYNRITIQRIGNY